jgi:hypothetical protein
MAPPESVDVAAPTRQHYETFIEEGYQESIKQFSKPLPQTLDESVRYAHVAELVASECPFAPKACHACLQS